MLEDVHLAEIEGVREESTLLLRNFYKVRFAWKLTYVLNNPIVIKRKRRMAF